jgi:serine/threonine protein phosphatase PrpC
MVYFEGRMEAPEIHPIAGGLAAIFSTSSPCKDTPNEDAAALIPVGSSSAVFLVADGLGGTRLGEKASRIAVTTIKAALTKAVYNGSELQSAILGAIEKANQDIIDLGGGAATTIVVAELNENVLRTYHVGDSVIMVFGQRGKIKLQTVSHSPVGFAVEAGVLDEKEALQHEERHLISNYLGSSDTRIEIGLPLRMAARDTLLLASDGLMDNLHVKEVVAKLRKGPVAAAACKLVSDSLKRMMNPVEGKPSKPDDITFIAYRGFGGRKQPGKPP